MPTPKAFPNKSLIFFHSYNFLSPSTTFCFIFSGLGCVWIGWKPISEINFRKIHAFGCHGKHYFPENDFWLTTNFTFDPEINFSPHFHFNSLPERERERESARAREEKIQSEIASSNSSPTARSTARSRSRRRSRSGAIAISDRDRQRDRDLAVDRAVRLKLELAISDWILSSRARALSLSLSLSLSGSELKWKWGEKFISGSKVKFVVNRKSFSGK